MKTKARNVKSRVKRRYSKRSNMAKDAAIAAAVASGIYGISRMMKKNDKPSAPIDLTEK